VVTHSDIRVTGHTLVSTLRIHSSKPMAF